MSSHGVMTLNQYTVETETCSYENILWDIILVFLWESQNSANLPYDT